MKMKNSFYSIWAKVVVCCFWMMIFSFLIVGLTVHLMNQLNVWNLLPLPLTGLHFIFVLAIITTILGALQIHAAGGRRQLQCETGCRSAQG